MRALSISIGVGLFTLLFARQAQSMEPSFGERVHAQEAIERVYYSHQLGAMAPFEEAVPLEVLQRRVAAYLQQSEELESKWQLTVTDEMLRREMDRIARDTRFPERLVEIEQALHFSPELVAECLARPVLVQRLLRAFAEGGDGASMAPPATPSPACMGDDSWNNGILLPPFNPDRPGHTAVWTGSKMIVWGGGLLDSGMLYDPLVDEWTATSTVGAPSGRRYHAAVWTGSRMIVWGGSGAAGVPPGGFLNDGGAYDPVTDTWSPIATAGAPSPRQTAAAVWTGTEMIVWGGYEGTVPNPTTGGRYNPASNTWAPTSNAGAPIAGGNLVSVWTGQRMVVWGGLTGTGGNPDSGGRYDPATDTWAPITTSGGPEHRYDATAVWSGTRMLVWGGVPSDSAVWIYDPVNDAWSTSATAGAPDPRGDATSVWTGTDMIVWGGYPNDTPTGGRYNLLADAWLPVTSSGAPSARQSHTAVWTGSRMVVWGGTADGSGGRYDPQNDVWTPTLIPASPVTISKRSAHTAIWTGNVMVVWGGGEGDGVPTQSGGRYDPLLDTWTPTSLTDAPAARRLHSAVWTGQRMLVWGGMVDAAGGAYDPIADTWTMMSRVNEPVSRRWNHGAVWTGTRMIVWGGEQFMGIVANDPTTCNQLTFGDGGSYDPASNAWTSLAPGGPGKRSSHSAVWTGSKLIVWGGEYFTWTSFPILGICFSSPVNVGAAYDPVANTWAPVATAGAPTAKVGHNAVWTGDRMIVWGTGGSTPSQILGGRYDPVNNTWSTVSELNAPSSAGVGLWTGSEMIVWTGTPGGRYTPATDSWKPMSSVHAPPADGAAGVWTGDAMLVWGASGGGRYYVGRPDGDHDGIADTCDACPLDPGNDADHDGHCADVDNCPNSLNAAQRDSDGDSRGDLCDNCPSIANASQIDTDADGAGDLCDCQPQDPNDRAPAEVASLAVGKSGTVATLSWTAASGADAYSVTRGEIASLAAGQYGSCLRQGVTATTIGDPDAPTPGQGFVYLVQAQNFDCGLGSLGFDFGEQPRTNANPSACAGVAVADAHLTAVSVVLGTLGGSGNSLSSNDAYLTVREVLSGGTSQLEGRFTFNVAAGSVKELHVEGFRTNSTDGDNFRFEYSTNGGGSFTSVVLSLPLTDDDIDRVAALPAGISGTVIVRVVDTDRTAGHNTLDIVAIDEIWIRSVP